MNNRGFTLLEVLIALGIVAVAFSAIAGLFGEIANTQAELKQKTFAQWVAINKTNEIYINRKLLDSGNAEGTEKMAGHPWYWKMKTSKTADKDIRRVELQVYVSRDSAMPAAVITSYHGQAGS
ncbi:MAG: GspI family T2SS minor pseudopilin variant ExeI [Gammaproteobacteria bacterium]|nr:MAG: GspI family T2SS minor pseudopilin variant ExeI [Gammaproteobacteria bacterium]